MPRGWLGAQADGPLTDLGNPFGSEFDLMRSSGVEAVRTAFDWRAAQPDENGPIDFAPMDAVVAAAAQRGLPVLPVVHRTPSWAAAHPGKGAASTPQRDGGVHAVPDRAGRALRAVGLAVGGAAGAAADADPRLADLERAEPDALLVHPAVREGLREAAAGVAARAARGRPGLADVLAGLPNESWIALRKIYKAGGRGAFDVVALHPYTGKPQNVIKLIEFARKRDAQATATRASRCGSRSCRGRRRRARPAGRRAS